MIKLNERIKLGSANDVFTSGCLQPGKNPEHAPTVDLHSGINLEDIIMLRKRRLVYDKKEFC